MLPVEYSYTASAVILVLAFALWFYEFGRRRKP